MNFTSYAPGSWKRGLIRCLLHRAFLVCSSWKLFHEELNRLQKLFVSNAYPIKMIQSVIKEFLTSQFEHKGSREPASDYKLLILPYFGKVSKVLSNRISQLCRKFNIQQRLVFRPYKVGAYFSLKTRCPWLLHSSVIYKYECPVAQGVTYIGKTSRHLLTRIKEHTRPNPTSRSAISDHIMNCSCIPSTANFTIIHSSRNDFDLAIAESLCIKELNPSLNQTIAGSGQSVFLKLF